MNHSVGGEHCWKVCDGNHSYITITPCFRPKCVVEIIRYHNHAMFPSQKTQAAPAQRAFTNRSMINAGFHERARLIDAGASNKGKAEGLAY